MWHTTGTAAARTIEQLFHFMHLEQQKHNNIIGILLTVHTGYKQIYDNVVEIILLFTGIAMCNCIHKSLKLTQLLQ